jgi:acyl carrier protein
MNLETPVLTSLMERSYIQRQEVKDHPVLSEPEERIISILENHTIPIPSSLRTPHLNFFACGLDSIGVIRFCSDIQESFGRHVDASEVMTSPIVSHLADLVTRPVIRSATPVQSLPYTLAFASEWEADVRRAYGKTVEQILPPFTIQEGVLSRSISEDTMYVQHVMLRCNPRASLARIKEAWRATQIRHPILRFVKALLVW